MSVKARFWARASGRTRSSPARCARTMSAMSKRARPRWAARTRLPALVRQQVQRTGSLAYELLGHAPVARGRSQTGMTEQRAYDAHVGSLLEQVRRETVPQHVRRHSLFDPRLLGCVGERGTHGLGARSFARLAGRKQVRQRRALPVPVLP